MSICEAKLRKLIITNALRNVMEKEINDQTNLVLDLDYDSQQIISLIVSIEDSFDFEFEIENLDLNVITNFGLLKNMINEKIISK